MFGGGLALYNSSRDVVGGLGASGDTSCADHNIAWRVRHALNLDFLAGVGGVSGDDVWAVGFRETGSDGPMSQPAAMHWDGEDWKQAETPEYHFPDPAPPEETASLDSVAAVSGDEVWAVGNHTFNHGEGGPEPEEEKILLRWDGGKWKKAPAAAADKATAETASAPFIAVTTSKPA